MRRHIRVVVHIGISVVAVCVPAFAHHSYTKFDMAKTMTLEGTVKELQWTNPHVWLQLMVKDPVTGRDVEWSIETDSPNMLARRGWSRKSLQPGDKAVAIVHPLKILTDGTTAALEAVTVNGQRIGGGSPPKPAEGAVR